VGSPFAEPPSLPPHALIARTKNVEITAVTGRAARARSMRPDLAALDVPAHRRFAICRKSRQFAMPAGRTVDARWIAEGPGSRAVRSGEARSNARFADRTPRSGRKRSMPTRGVATCQGPPRGSDEIAAVSSAVSECGGSCNRPSTCCPCPPPPCPCRTLACGPGVARSRRRSPFSP